MSQTGLRVRPADPAGLTALVSLSHLDSETETFLSDLNIAARSGAGSSVKFLEIARGNADVYPRFGPTMEWDTAAGQAVLEAAGGTVVTTDGKHAPLWQVRSGLAQSELHRLGRKKRLTGAARRRFAHREVARPTMN